MDSAGAKIKKLRLEKGLSKADVARVCGITQTAFANIENEFTKSITISVGKGIAKALGINFNELFNPEEDKNITEIKNQFSQLKEIISELKNRISDKDLIIKAISQQLNFFKYQFIALIDFLYWTEYKKCEDQLENCTDENERKKILNELNEIRELEKNEFADLVKNGTLDQKDIMENLELMSNESKRPGYRGSLLKYIPLYLD